IPSLIDRLIEGTASKQGTLASESLAGLLKRNWDPISPSINQQKLKKLPDNPLLLFIPGISISSNLMVKKRHKFWQNQLSSMGKVINVMSSTSNPNKSVVNCVESMISTTRAKILELKDHFPGRLIVLIGWNVGALVALHVSLVEAVHAVVCLGFPTMGISGNRGEVDDPVYNCKTPTFFVVGQYASATNLDCLEDIRERLRVETGLLLVGGADDQLRMSRAKKRHCGLTQHMVDRCIMEEMFEFLGNTLFQVMVQPENKVEPEVTKKQAKKRKHKDLPIAAGSQTVDNIVKPAGKDSSKLGYEPTYCIWKIRKCEDHSKESKKAVPRKRLGKAAANAGQKPFVHLTLPVIASTTGGKPANVTPSLSEAAAIASAPELSTLLQSIKTTSEQALTSATKSSSGPLISSKISSTAATSLLAPSSSTTPTTTALTLSKFLASSSFLKCIPSGDLSVEDPVASLDSKSNSDPLSDIDLEELSGKEESPVKNQPQQLQQPQQPQILIKTGLSSAPFSIPLTFSMASKVLKSGTAVKLTSSSSSTQQIQNLLMSSKSNAPTASTQSAQVSEEVSPPLEANCNTLPINSASVVSIDKISQSSGSQRKSDVKSSYLASVGDMPKASVIDIGNDTVYLKENPPSKNSAPGTVSIDLGQIASGNGGNAVKLQSSSRISLIPSVKQVPHSISSTSSSSSSLTSSPERTQLSSPVPFSQGNQQASSISKPQPRLGFSSPGKLLLTTTPSIQATTPTILQTSSQFSLSGLSSSQLLSTLSSSTGIIRFKLTSQVENKNTDIKQSSQGSDETDGNAKPPTQTSDPFAKSSKIPSFIDLTEVSPPNSKQGIKTLTALAVSQSIDSPPNSKQGIKTVTALAGSQTLSLLSLKGAGKDILSNHLFTSGSTSSLKQALNQCSTQAVPDALHNQPSSHQKIPCTANAETSSTKEGTQDKQADDLKPPEAVQEEEPVSKIETPSSDLSLSPLSSHSSKTLTSPISQSQPTKSNKSSISYTAMTRPVLASVASTRTRRIKVPKQYDL
ncbi:KAT8 regulatory NSL complex subunit 3, partial [Elysia marginata]